jgi:nucleotidyltransferase/DNA polymerase involved in DNA repair
MKACMVETADPLRPADRLVGELRGVPKPVLQTVFGKGLGRRIWQQARRSAGAGRQSQTAPGGNAEARTAPTVVTNGEIVGGMIEYVSRRAGETLSKNQRQAQAIGLSLVYADGVSKVERMRLARPTSDAQELSAAAMALFRRAEARGVTVASVDLTVTSVQTEVVTERAGGLDGAIVSAVAARA